MQTFWNSMKKYKVLWILVLVFAGLIYIANEISLTRGKIVYPESLDTVVATVQNQEITLRDFAIYVAHQEKAIQEQAIAYDADNTRRYWNIRTDMGFVNQVARNEAMSMAIHDTLFYQLFLEQKLTLTEEEQNLLANDVEDFWLDLVDEDKVEKLGINKEDVANSMYKIACAQKAQLIYAGIEGVHYENLDFTAEVFLEFLENYEYEVNDEVLNRLDFGDITLTHK